MGERAAVRRSGSEGTTAVLKERERKISQSAHEYGIRINQVVSLLPSIIIKIKRVITSSCSRV